MAFVFCALCKKRRLLAKKRRNRWRVYFMHCVTNEFVGYKNVSSVKNGRCKVEHTTRWWKTVLCAIG